MSEPKMVRMAKPEDCAIVMPNRQHIVMEVVGLNGNKVAEYVDKKSEPKPYHRLIERVQA